MATQVTQPAGRTVGPKRLWFGFAGGAAAWIVQELVTVFISSNSCDASGQLSWGGLPESSVRILLGAVTLVLFLTGATAASVAFRDWRLLVGENRSFQKAEAYGRKEFMSLAGFVIGALCTVGIFWAGLPLLLLDICMRAH